MINLNNDVILRDRFLDMGFTDWLEDLNNGINESMSNGTFLDYINSYAESMNSDTKKSKKIFLNAGELYYVEIF